MDSVIWHLQCAYISFLSYPCRSVSYTLTPPDSRTLLLINEDIHHYKQDYIDTHHQDQPHQSIIPTGTTTLADRTSTTPFELTLEEAKTSRMTTIVSTLMGQAFFPAANIHMAGRPSRPRPPKPPQPRDGDTRYAFMSLCQADDFADFDTGRSLLRGGGNGGGKGSGGPQPRDDGKSRWCRGGGSGNEQDPKGPWPRDPGSRRGKMSYDPQPRDPGR